MKRVFFIRHGQSEANVDWHILKTKEEWDIALTPKGRKQAEETGRALKGVFAIGNLSDPLFIVSPWKRADQTYQEITDAMGIVGDPIYDYNVTEHYMNLVKNKKNWENFADFRESGWDFRKALAMSFEGGETLGHVIERAQLFVDWLKHLPSDPIIVVSHGQFIKICVSIIDGTDPFTMGHPKNCEVITREI